MDENEIANKLKQNIPTAPAPVTPTEPGVLTDEQSSALSDSNEFALFKIGRVLGLDDPLRTDLEPKLSYIYEQAATLSGKTDYDGLLETINQLLLKQGWLFEEDRFNKLWLWLRLNQERLAIDSKMGSI